MVYTLKCNGLSENKIDAVFIEDMQMQDLFIHQLLRIIKNYPQRELYLHLTL